MTSPKKLTIDLIPKRAQDFAPFSFRWEKEIGILTWPSWVRWSGKLALYENMELFQWTFVKDAFNWFAIPWKNTRKMYWKFWWMRRWNCNWPKMAPWKARIYKKIGKTQPNRILLNSTYLHLWQIIPWKKYQPNNNYRCLPMNCEFKWTCITVA